MAKLDEQELKALLASERSASLSSGQSGKLANERTSAINYYRNDVSADIPDIVGRSKTVSSDVADTIEGLMPSLMEIFAGSDDAVRFDPTGPEDEAAADQETEYIKKCFWDQNDGYLVLYSIIKDALLEKLGICKVWWDTETKIETETYYDQNDMQLALIMQSKDIQIVAHSAKQDDMGQTLHDVQVEMKKEWGYAHVEAVPPEEFGIAKRARKIKDSPYCFHEVVKTESDLIAEGYDPDQVIGLPSYGTIWNAEMLARDTVEENAYKGDPSINKAMRPIRLTEHYVRMDYERKGKSQARLYQVITGGEDGVVLQRKSGPAVSEWDLMPFCGITPFIMTHRVFGLSVADVVMDIQRVKTILMRNLLDNTYASNLPRPVVASAFASDTTLDDLAVFRHGAPIRTKQPGAIEWQQVPSIINHVFPVVQYFDSVREWRTGVSRQAAGLDADALNNQTATAAMQLYNAAQARMKLIARTFAETGIKDLFLLLHATILKHKNQAEIVRLTNKWIPVDPRNWKTRNDVTVSVGLGQGGKTERMMQLQKIMDMQAAAIKGGMTDLVTPMNLYNSGKEICKIIEQNTELFFTEPPPDAKIQPPTPPEMIKAQTEIQKMQMDSQIRVQEIQGKAGIEKLQAQADVASQDRKVQSEIALAEMKMRFDMALEQQRFELEREMKMMEMGQKEHQFNLETTQAQHQHQLDMEAAEMGIQSQGEKALLTSASQADKHAQESKAAAGEQRMKADEHKMKMKEMAAKNPPISNAIKQLKDGQAEHSKALGEILQALNEDREITISRDAKGKPAGAVSRRKKPNGSSAKPAR